MTREIKDKPHPTPHPDAPHIHGARDKGSGSGESVPGAESIQSEEPNYDSCLDDLNLILSQANQQPDPVLESAVTTDAMLRASGAAESAPACGREPAKQPRTSEVFKAVASVGGLGAGPTAGALAPSPRPPGTAAILENDPEAASRAEDLLAASGPGPVRMAAEYDDHVAESRIPWFSLLLLSYSSVITLALTWIIWTGRISHTGEGPSANSAQTAAEPVTKPAESTHEQDLPAIPAENLVSLDQTIRIGDLEVTPLSVDAIPLDLVRSLAPADSRREESESVVLRLRLANISGAHDFAPLERAFVREQASPFDRSFIATSSGVKINVFPLAVDSEWSIDGQKFPVVKRGESVETLIGSEPGKLDQLTDHMTWRVRLRIGPYRTDVVGIKFTKSDVVP